MKELSMHILDIAANSIRAEAKNIEILVKEDLVANRFIFEIKDDGKGMSQEMVNSLSDPFTTSRTLRKVGLGIPLLKQNCQLCDGDVTIESELGVGTTLKSYFQYDHIDRPPLGDIASSISGLMSSNESVNIHYIHDYKDKRFEVSTKELKEALEDVSLTEISVMKWLRDFLKENIDEIQKNHD